MNATIVYGLTLKRINHRESGRSEACYLLRKNPNQSRAVKTASTMFRDQSMLSNPRMAASSRAPPDPGVAGHAGSPVVTTMA